MRLHYDFHIHSCLSPCGDDEMTPCNIVGMAKLMGLDVIALTDHNSCLNCPAVVAAGEREGVLVIPGMELCTAEEAHIVCLFETVEKALAFSEYVENHSFAVKNRPEIFGRQLICDENDNVTGEYENLLVTASDITVGKVEKTVRSFGGVCYPAHIDRSSYSVVSNLGTITKEMGFEAAELSDAADENAMKEKFPVLEDMLIINSSDAHDLERLCRKAATIECKAASVSEILAVISRG